MLIQSAIVPPGAIVDELTAALRSGQPAFDVFEAADLRLPIAGFGNVTAGDARRLADALTLTASEWPTPRVFFAGATTVDFATDRRIWASLQGDIDALTRIARDVTTRVQRLGFYVDRRLFQRLVPVASANAVANDADVDRLLAELASFRGQDWTVDAVVLTTQGFVDGVAETREYERIPLG